MNWQSKTRFLGGIAFFREWIRAPRAIGAVYPSSRSLAQKMAEKVECCGTGLVIELGAGTGCVTEALLMRGINPARLLVLERAQPLVDVLQRKFPGINIIRGDASRLSAYIPPGKKVDCIVSSLPFASLDAAITAGIIAEIKKNAAGGRVVQYTYLLGKAHILCRSGFECISVTTVWRNLPPAKVMEFVLEEAEGALPRRNRP